MMVMSSTTGIDDLPKCLIILIFSFLPSIDAIRASLVCRNWLNLWHHVPFLNFDIVSFHSPSNPYPQTRESFTKLVRRAFRVRPHNPLRKLYIRVDCDSVEDRINITSWIKYAIKCGVRELDLDLYTCDLSTTWLERLKFSDDEINKYFSDYADYCFDFSCVTNSTIENLKFHIGRCEFPLALGHPKSAKFTSLTSLTLDDVSFIVGVELTRLVRNCTNLEHLTIVNCTGLRHIRIVSSRLKTCKCIFSPEKGESFLVITSPCLHSLTLSYVCVENDILNLCPNLIKLELECEEYWIDYYGWWYDTLRLLTWVKYLVVPNRFSDNLFKFITRVLDEKLPYYKFDNLSHLELHTGYGFDSDIRGICSFLKNVPALEQLVLNYCYWKPWHQDEPPITEDLTNGGLFIPRLERVKMKGYRGTVGELYVLELLKTHGVALKEVVAFPAQSGDEWLKPFTLFLSS